jgi:hypothetical protein
MKSDWHFLVKETTKYDATHEKIDKKPIEVLYVFDTMLSSLVEILRKGILTQEEWERKIEMKSLKAASLKSYRDVQFSSKH